MTTTAACLAAADWQDDGRVSEIFRGDAYVEHFAPIEAGNERKGRTQ
jgi:hypothetical protein